MTKVIKDNIKKVIKNDLVVRELNNIHDILDSNFIASSLLKK